MRGEDAVSGADAERRETSSNDAEASVAPIAALGANPGAGLGDESVKPGVGGSVCGGSPIAKGEARGILCASVASCDGGGTVCVARFVSREGKIVDAGTLTAPEGDKCHSCISEASSTDVSCLGTAAAEEGVGVATKGPCASGTGRLGRCGVVVMVD